MHVGDIGTAVTLAVTNKTTGEAIDLSEATELLIRARKPGGDVVEWTAEFLTDGTDGQIVYYTQAEDLDVAGAWHFMGFVTLPAGAWATDDVLHTVHPIIS